MILQYLSMEIPKCPGKWKRNAFYLSRRRTVCNRFVVVEAADFRLPILFSILRKTGSEEPVLLTALCLTAAANPLQLLALPGLSMSHPLALFSLQLICGHQLPLPHPCSARDQLVYACFFNPTAIHVAVLFNAPGSMRRAKRGDRAGPEGSCGYKNANRHDGYKQTKVLFHDGLLVPGLFVIAAKIQWPAASAVHCNSVSIDLCAPPMPGKRPMSYLCILLISLRMSIERHGEGRLFQASLKETCNEAERKFQPAASRMSAGWRLRYGPE